MKKANNNQEKMVETLEEYDFSNGVRGKYAEKFAEGSNVVILDPDVSEIFHNAESVNSTLRALAKIIRLQSEKKPTRDTE